MSAQPVVTVRCAACGHERRIGPGEIAPDDFPMCPTDGMPLIVVKAEVTFDPEQAA